MTMLRPVFLLFLQSMAAGAMRGQAKMARATSSFVPSIESSQREVSGKVFPLETAFDFRQVQNKLNAVLEGATVSEDDPAVLFVWDLECLSLLASSCNNQVRAGNAQPPWMASIPGNVTATSLSADIVQSLATVGGGRTGNVMIAPNTMAQYGHIRARMGQLEMEPFLQASIAALPQGARLATVYQLKGRNVAHAEPVVCPAPLRPTMQLFY